MNERNAPLAGTDVNARAVVLVALAILAFLGAAMGILALVFFTVVPRGPAAAPGQPPQPQLQAHPGDSLQQLLARQRSQLSGYRWASSDHTRVAIPIERAMELIAQRGPEGYAPIVAAPAAAPSQPGAKP